MPTAHQPMIFRRLAATTMVLVALLLLAGGYGTFKLLEQARLRAVAQAFASLASSAQATELAARRAVVTGHAEDRARLRAAWLGAIAPLQQLRLAYADYDPRQAAQLRDAPILERFDAMLAEVAPESRIGASAPSVAAQTDICAMLFGTETNRGLIVEAAETLLMLRAPASGSGPLTDSEVALLRMIQQARDRRRGAERLHEAALAIQAIDARSGSVAMRMLGLVVGVGVLAALGNLFLLLWPMARRAADERNRLAAALDDARAADRAKSEFLATMSHELRTPLNGVIGMAALMEATELTPRQRICAQTIRSAAEGLGTVIADILEFARVDRGALRLERGPVPLVRLGNRALEVAAPTAALKGLDLIVRIHPASPAILTGDRIRLDHIIQNLLSNAIKFTRSGEVMLELGAHPVSEAEAMLRIAVHDTGIGIAPDAVSRLFMPFTQLDQTATREAGGIGLGLAICTSLLELMNGTIRFQPRPAGGTVFTAEIVLPVADHGPAIPVEPGLVGLGVLVLCVVPTRAGMLRELIEAFGARVTMLDTAGAFAAAAAALPRSIGVIDHHPPVVDADALLIASGPATVVLGPQGWQSDAGDAIAVAHPALVEPMRAALLAARARLAEPAQPGPAVDGAPLRCGAAKVSMRR